MVYRGAVSFTLTARAEGELLENNQVVLMMRLSLCMIWMSVFQHLLTTNPHFPLHVKFDVEGDGVMKELDGGEERITRPASRSMDSLYPFFVYHYEPSEHSELNELNELNEYSKHSEEFANDKDVKLLG